MALQSGGRCSDTVDEADTVVEDTPRYSVSVAAAVLRDDGRILAVQRRDNRRWEPPGGVLERDEAVEDGLRREVREETGLDVEPERLTGVYQNMSRGIVALVLRCRPLAGQPHETPETARVRWMTSDEIRREMVQAYAVRMLDALDGDPPAVRSHDGVRLL